MTNRTYSHIQARTSDRPYITVEDAHRNFVEYIFGYPRDSKSSDRAPVSIICHSYNHESYIADAFKGFESQPDNLVHEIIINDDCSTDHTLSILFEWANRTKKSVRIIAHTENKWMKGGVRPAQHTFIKAGGDYIAFCEGDDFWTDPEKLTKQLEAMRTHPSVDLCTHAAYRLSMSNGKKSRHFDHGQKMRIISSERVIARHNQFSASASMFMRAKAVRQLPHWFFHEPGLAVTDFFVEAILSRRGVLYMPDTMSVYRRNVPGSYTKCFRQSSGQSLESSLLRLLHFTEKLRGMEGIPEHALEQRLSYIRLNYALQFLAMGDRDRFSAVVKDIALNRHHLPQAGLRLMSKNSLAFNLGRWGFQRLRKLL